MARGLPVPQPNKSAAGAPQSRGNRLLAALPATDYARLRPVLEPVVLRLRQVLSEPGDAITHVYFPTMAVVPLLLLVEDGTSVEIALVGNDGLIGQPLALGLDRATHRALNQIPGIALRLSAGAFRSALNQSGALRQVLQRYTQALLVQAAQGAACNRLHSIYGRCARRLLETHDRVDQDEFPLTQDLFASFLAVRRATVSVAAGRLQQAGLIRYHRGSITVLDRAGLQAAACECYRTIKTFTDRLLGPDRRFGR